MNPIRKAIIASALVGTTLVGGAVGATMITPVSAQETETTTPSITAEETPATSEESGPAAQDDGRPADRGGGNETELTGEVAEQAIAAAQAAEPDATVVRAETDDGGVYEVHMTRADGTEITVKVDAEFNVTEVVEGGC